MNYDIGDTSNIFIYRWGYGDNAIAGCDANIR